MCGIIGFHTENPSDEQFEAPKRVFEQSRIRGLHAFGFAFKDGKYLSWRRYHNLMDLKRALETYRPTTLIGHNRYSTSGDWQEIGNNQPVTCPGQALVFNGVIDMGTKEEIEAKYGIKMQSDNDGEIFLAQLDPEEFVRNMKGSFAGLYARKGNFYFIRNPRRPAYYVKEFGATYVASTADILKRAGFKNKPIELPPYTQLKLKDL